MSRSGYTDDWDYGDNWSTIMWRGAVKSSIKGKRGQAFLRELLAALDSMPDKRLIASAAQKDGCMCTLGVVAAARGLSLDDLNSSMEGWEWDRIADDLGIAEAMAREIMELNDEHTDEFEWVPRPEGPPTPEEWHAFERSYSYRLSDDIRRPILDAPARRWRFMRDWVAKQVGAEVLT